MALVAQTEARAPMLAVNLRRQGLETAKEILAEVFGARPSDVEEMIRLREEWQCSENYIVKRAASFFC